MDHKQLGTGLGGGAKDASQFIVSWPNMQAALSAGPRTTQIVHGGALLGPQLLKWEGRKLRRSGPSLRYVTTLKLAWTARESVSKEEDKQSVPELNLRKPASIRAS